MRPPLVRTLSDPSGRPTRSNRQAIRMSSTLDSPFIVFVISLAAQWVGAFFGDLIHKWVHRLSKVELMDFDKIQAAALTLLALIIGFTFSMAVTRYDQRKNYEAAEANAIGTEYVRAELLPAGDAEKVRQLLRDYLAQRIAYYEASDPRQTGELDADATNLQTELWSAILRPAQNQPTPVIALTVWGMNDVLNAQSYTQAAWWNRIPAAAWALMGLIAISCNMLIGYGERRSGLLLLLVLPIIVSVSFMLIADIDSPRGGVIRVLPHNLIALSQSMKAH
jgi:hypothetical protein